MSTAYISNDFKEFCFAIKISYPEKIVELRNKKNPLIKEMEELTNQKEYLSRYDLKMNRHRRIEIDDLIGQLDNDIEFYDEILKRVNEILN